jgi:uncharacterized protein YacL
MKIVNENIVCRYDLPNATLILVLGILSIVMSFNNEILGFILSIITLIISSRSLRLFRKKMEQYELSSYKRIVVGRICAIIGLLISIFAFIIAILVFLGLFGGISLLALFDKFI